MPNSADDDQNKSKTGKNKKTASSEERVDKNSDGHGITWEDLFGFSPADHNANEEQQAPEAEVYDPKDPTRVRVEHGHSGGVPYANVFIAGLVYKDFLTETEKLTLKANGNHFEVERLLARSWPNLLETFPVNARYYNKNYLRPKYGKLTKVSLVNYDQPWNIPNDTKEFESLLKKFPHGFGIYALFGLGAWRKYTEIFSAISIIPGITELIIVNDKQIEVQGSTYLLGYDAYENLRRAIDSIINRSQRESLNDRSILIHNELRHAVNPTAFPKKFKPLKPGALYELVNLGAARANRSKEDRKAAMKVVKSEVEIIAKSDPKQLLSLRESIEIATLGNIIETFVRMLSKEQKEKDWQDFFFENLFILTLAFSYPAFVIGREQRIGVSAANGRGAKITDFLFSQDLTGNLAILEIKTPECGIIGKPYRGKKDEEHTTYSMHADLSGALIQVLDQRARLQTNFTTIAYESRWHDYHAHAVQCILIAGKDPINPEEKKSFELFRQSNKDVVIITFSELLNKLKGLHAVMKSWSDEKERAASEPTA